MSELDNCKLKCMQHSRQLSVIEDWKDEPITWILSRTHVSDPSKLKCIETALRNLLALQMPLINQILTYVAQLAVFDILGIYITNASEVVELSKGCGRVIGECGGVVGPLGFYSKDPGLVVCSYEFLPAETSMEAILIHEFVHVAVESPYLAHFTFDLSLLTPFIRYYEEKFGIPTSFEKIMAQARCETKALWDKGYPHRLSLELLQVVMRELRVYEGIGLRDKWKNEFLSLFFQEFVGMALRENMGDVPHAVSFFSNGALKLRAWNYRNRIDNFYDAVILAFVRKGEQEIARQKLNLDKKNQLKRTKPVTALNPFSHFSNNCPNTHLSDHDIQLAMIKLQRSIVIITGNGKIKNPDCLEMNFTQAPIFLYEYRGVYHALVVTHSEYTADILNHLLFQTPHMPLYKQLAEDHQHALEVRSHHARILSHAFEFITGLDEILRTLFQELNAKTREVKFSSEIKSAASYDPLFDTSISRSVLPMARYQ